MCKRPTFHCIPDRIAGKSPFRHLIYPLPEHGGLGVHLTLDMAGVAKFGPDVEWVDGEQYAVDPARADVFYPAIRTYFPGLKDGALAPSYSGAGMRQCQRAGSPAAGRSWVDTTPSAFYAFFVFSSISFCASLQPQQAGPPLAFGCNMFLSL